MKLNLLILSFILLLSSCYIDDPEYFSNDKAIIVKIESAPPRYIDIYPYKYLITLDAKGYNIAFLTDQKFNVGDTVYFVSHKQNLNENN